MKLALALDNFSSSNKATIRALAYSCLPYVDVVKIGLELFTRFGPEALSFAGDRETFLDLKLKDIPNTVKNAVHEANKLGVDYLTIHGNSDPEMLKAASGAAKKIKLLAVTKLTSSNVNDEKQIFDEVHFVSKMCYDLGIKGFVAPVPWVQTIKSQYSDTFVVTPGIRLKSKIKSDDQKHIATPQEAFEAGTDIIVIGRPVTASTNPVKVLQALQKYRTT